MRRRDSYATCKTGAESYENLRAFFHKVLHHEVATINV